MYSEADLQSAVSAGAISAEAAEALRGHAASLRASPVADEEQFRLITGFNDVFVTIACALVIFAAAAVGGGWLGGLLVAAASWLMAEVFTLRRRMALPSIVLLLAFTIAIGIAVGSMVSDLLPTRVESWRGMEHDPWQGTLITASAGFFAALAAWAHWLRFRVAITIAAGVGAIVLLFLAALAALTGQELESNAIIVPAAFVCGLAVFALAMRWDLTDPQRKTQRADVAFWLHLLAAPLIAHPLFYWMGVTSGEQISVVAALGVVGIYLLFGVVALAVDRRALLVSALAYVLAALFTLFRFSGAIELSVALTALVIGVALLTLSAFWSPIRTGIIGNLPEGVRARLPH